MKTITVEKVTPDDLHQLQKVSTQTFLEAFAATNGEENMRAYMDKAFSLQRLTAELQDKNSEFYFARSANEVVGYLKLNFGQSQTDIKDDKALEIERIYILQEFYGKQVGQMLFNKAIEVAQKSAVDYIWLGVWEENPRAISFYKKNGFVEFDKHIFKLGNEEQTDIMMKLKLKTIS